MLKVDLTKAKKLNKRGYSWLKSYLNSNLTMLDECYINCSNAKYKAYYNNIDLMRDCGGFGFRILGYNCNFFPVAFLMKKGNYFYLFVNSGRNIYLYEFMDVEIAFKIGSFEFFDKFLKLAKGGF